jgi:hypothetical protein
MELRLEIAILDIGLPVMDGHDLATALRRLPGLANLQLIAVNGVRSGDRPATDRSCRLPTSTDKTWISRRWSEFRTARTEMTATHHETSTLTRPKQ